MKIATLLRHGNTDIPGSLNLENPIMSMIHRTNGIHRKVRYNDSFEIMHPREQLLGVLVLILALLLAALLRSM